MQFIKNLIAKLKTKKFLKSRNVELDGDSGDYSFSINGLIVREFGYLLRYVSGEKVENFDDLDFEQHYQSITQGINAELAAPILREEESLGVPHAIAIGNMQNFKGIIETIHNYVAFKHSL